eukprot:TRINITY_DN74172_c0_g1_i1.p1 TRINITY_DN74172_c0_g1~~TRINITY_DN74172_c0_g1_i1.p1  ORF type:complete len:657 (-),score=97.49 TRINITY_DN74172_c0_g1_i1:236-2206(-)
MTAWRTDTGEISKYFDSSALGLVERIKLWARANDLPEAEAEAAFEAVAGPNKPLELTEGYLRVNDSSTEAPHIRGPEDKGQKYRYFKNGPQVLGQWYSSNCLVHAEKDFIVYKGPDAADGNERYSFAEALSIAGGLASYMYEELGVQKGDRVAQISRNNPEWILSFMAATASGCVAVPTNSWWSSAELEYGINNSGTVVAFIDGERAARILPLCREGKLPTMKAVIVSRDAEKVAAHGGGKVRVLSLEEVMASAKGRTIPKVEVSPEDSALIMYTSGTTSHPKGVVSTHRSVVNALRNAMFYPHCSRAIATIASKATLTSPRLARKERTPQAAICPVPLFHATGSHALFLMSFIVGRKLVLMHKWDPLEALKLIESEKITTFIGVPTMSMEILSHPDFAKYDVSSLMNMAGGGAAPPNRLSADAARKGKTASQAWGLTESNSMTVTTFSSKEYVANPASCGRAMVLVDVKIVDDDNRELSPGEVGEVLIRGATIMKEYWNNPKATAEAISVDGWFRTGDVGKLDPDGSLYILDRAKDLIIRGGENISCAEVETALYDHPSIQECCVFSMPDERLGEIVAAAIVQNPGTAFLSGSDVTKFCLERMAKFKVPEELYLWREGLQLPRGATGKIPKREVRKQIQDGNAPCAKILPPQAKM